MKKKINLKVENIGQIQNANIDFGDLTVFVGPQATGKSILLQLLKLLIDSAQIKNEILKHGGTKEKIKEIKSFFDVYFGEGMNGIWNTEKSKVVWKENTINIEEMIKGKTSAKSESVFFVPAQRVLAMRDGWPRPFSDYNAGDPFVVREFSEKLRLLTEATIADIPLFPKTNRLKGSVREKLEESIFSNMALKIDRSRLQKRFILNLENHEENLPFMVWSAGQREFVPLLLGLYWLLPAGRTTKKKEIDWIIIEELEMGLHPQAISAVLLLILDLLSRGYRICLSTHSPHVLDVVWAIKMLKENQAESQNLLKIFQVKKDPYLLKMSNEIYKKNMKVHYFDRGEGTTRDITDLDPSSEKIIESGWGGLSEFSGRVADIVAEAVSRNNQ